MHLDDSLHEQMRRLLQFPATGWRVTTVLQIVPGSYTATAVGQGSDLVFAGCSFPSLRQTGHFECMRSLYPSTLTLVRG